LIFDLIFLKKVHLISNLKIEIMSVLKVIEVLTNSEISWEDATRKGVAKAAKSVKNIRSVYVKDHSAAVEEGKITEYRVTLKLTFELE
jgi:flavin-binding protein dodecin